MKLEEVALCADCDTCYSLAELACPSCTSRTRMALGVVLSGRPARVALADVLHHAGNGLTPARCRAEQLDALLTAYVDSGLALHRAFNQRAAEHARVIVTAIDQTLARLRSLGLGGSWPTRKEMDG